MMLLTTLRGRDSTGLSGIDFQDDMTSSLVKVLGTPDQLNLIPNMTRFWERFFFRYTSVIGHCRAATKGAVSADNAHPFKSKHITLAHNGTLRNFETLKAEYRLPKVQVDSELIAILFAGYGAEVILPKLEGAYALIWFDETNKTMNWCRNYERPLFLAKTRDKDTIILASEKATLEWNASRHVVFYDSLEEVPVHTVFSLDMNSKNITPAPYTIPVKKWAYSNGYEEYEPIVSARAFATSVNVSEAREGEPEKNDVLMFDVLDYHRESFPGTQGAITKTTRVDLFCEEYPELEFFGVFGGHPEEKSFARVGTRIRGTLNRMMTRMGNGAQTRVGSVINLEVIENSNEAGTDENGIVLTTYGTELVKLSKARLEHLLKIPCEWCNEPHKREGNDHTKLDALIFVKMEHSAYHEDRLVCNECVVSTKNCPVQ